MGLVQELMSADRYETESLPELISRIENKNASELDYINEKYSQAYKTYRDVPFDILEKEGEDASSLVEMSYVMREYPKEY